MNFCVMPEIKLCDSFEAFLKEEHVSEKDLMITNRFIVDRGRYPGLACDILYQEDYGRGEPTDVMADAMLQMVKHDYDRIIAVGGGTVLDISKLFVFDNGLTCAEIFEQGEQLKKKRKLISIPTTCGTGSEVTGISIISFERLGTKKGLSTKALYSDEAVLIPELLDSLPYEVFAASAIDALIHAVESFLSPNATEFSRTYSEKAMKMLLQGLMEHKESIKERRLPGTMDQFLYASTMAGIAFGNAGCAAVHALSYPIGAIYHVPHGKANWMMFKAVFDMYRRQEANLSALERILEKVFNNDRPWDELFGLLDIVLEKPTFRQLEIDEKKCKAMAISVFENQQRLLKNTPVLLSANDIYKIYLSCL